ncbi:anti-phage protein KwaB [Vibrio owensii]|uniref:anti-phage protein KwaB n=1 Tax=Vibrio owensii TaxID=696485 RepID=UPI003CE46A28
MNNQQIKAILKDFAENATGIKFYFVDANNNITASDIRNEELDSSRGEFCNSLLAKFVNNESFTTPFLSNYDERKHALYKFDFDETPTAFGVLDRALAIRPDEQIDVYQARDNKLENIEAVIIALKHRDGRQIGFYQQVFTVSLLQSQRGIANLTAHESRVIKLQTDVLRISPNFVFAKVGDEVLVENVKALENQLGFKDVVHAQARSYFDQITEMNFADDMNIFLEKIEEDTSFARKVVKVARHSAVLESSISTEDLIAFVKQKEHYANVLKFNEDETQFDFKSINRCRKFLELLDDDLLTSPLTNKDYIARSKDRL